ncbi:MAG: hypothetical protein V3T72_06655 [Thermoanaerobaculia bacterium]
MSGYLQRLVARAAESGDEPANLRPSLKSASPIAELDSRIGIPGLEDGGLGITRSTRGGGGEDAPPRFPGGTTEATPTIQRQAAVASAPSAVSAASPAPSRPYLDTVLAAAPAVAPAEPAAISRRQSPPAPPAQSDGPPEMAALPSPVASDVVAEPPALAVPETLAPSRLSIDEPAAPETPSPTTQQLAASAKPADPETGAPSLAEAPSLMTAPSKSRRDAGAPSKKASAASENTGAEIPRLMPPVAALPLPEPRPAARRAPEPATPRVVIGRIDVEVVPPQPATAAGSEPRPVTAAAVSKIGPLRPAVRTNLLFNLRRS